MKKQQPISAALVAIVAAFILASAGTLLANGQAFSNGQANPEKAVRHHRRSVHRDCHSFPGRRPGTFQEPGHRRRDSGSQLSAYRHQADGNHDHRSGLSDDEGRVHPSPVEGRRRAQREDGAENERRQHRRQRVHRRRESTRRAGRRQQQRTHGLGKADDLPVGGLLRSGGYFSGGANSRPPRVHRALSPRSRAMGVAIPRLRSNTSP